MIHRDASFLILAVPDVHDGTRNVEIG